MNKVERLQRRQAVLRGNRRMVLVDIENVVGGSCPSQSDASWAHDVVYAAISAGPDDQVVIGSGPSGLIAAADGWAGARYEMRRGIDGADQALLAVMDEDLSARFAEIVLVSGDGIFTERIAAFEARGVRTTVVAHSESLSRSLRMAAGRVIYLPHGRHDEAAAVAPVSSLRWVNRSLVLSTRFDLEAA